MTFGRSLRPIWWVLGIVVLVAGGLWLGVRHAARPGASTARVEESPAAPVRVLVDGQPQAAGAVKPGADIVLDNGRVRLRRVSGEQLGSHHLQVRVGGDWLDATNPQYGDWTFVDSTVSQPPTEVQVIGSTSEEVAVEWLFGAHSTGPPGGRPVPYPFRKTIWLRRGDYGYFVWIEPLQPLDQKNWYAGHISEHEVGFGGLWGPARYEIADRVFTIEARSMRELGWDEPFAARFERGDDPLVRILVPIPPGPVLIPSFAPSRFGSIFIHHREPRAYGGYLYSAPRQVASGSDGICESAWRTAPRPMPARNTRCLSPPSRR